MHIELLLPPAEGWHYRDEGVQVSIELHCSLHGHFTPKRRRFPRDKRSAAFGRVTFKVGFDRLAAFTDIPRE